MSYTEDDITTHEGADEPLVALWDDGVVTAGNIRELCIRMRDVVDGETPLAVYVREGDELTQATLRVLERAGNLPAIVDVSRNRYEGNATVAWASLED